MEISFLPEGYVINAAREIDKGIESDFLIRAIRVKNNTTHPVTITDFRFDVKIKGQAVKQVSYTEETMENLARNLSTNVKNLEDQIAEVRQIFLGTKKFWENELVSEEPILEFSQETGILLEHFRILKNSPIDECLVTVMYTQSGKEKNVHLRIPVVQYENKNDYIFPLKGTWLVVNNYDDIHVHRRMHSQEFAMDLIQLSPDFKHVPGVKSRNEKYACYGSKIYAVVDGEVTSYFDKMPENPPGLGSRLPQEEWDKIKERHGFVSWAAGNYVILKHSDEEYSFYAHMITGSVTVKIGQKVKQGQVIGRVGNSGNSDAPHLHFHLMVGPSILTARGLSCRFTNLRDMDGDPLPFIEMNRSIVHAE